MSAIKKFEVTSDGIARIPKSTPVPVAASSSLGSADGDVPMVRRLDGTWEALPSKINNPNFAPRQAHPGGKIVTNDKDEVHVKFYTRKKVPIEQWPEHVRRKKEEMDAAAAASNAAKGGVFARLGGGAGGGRRRGGGRQRDVQERLGPVARRARRRVEEAEAVKGKGGVRVLSGAEGGVFARLGGGAAAAAGARAGAAAAAKGRREGAERRRGRGREQAADRRRRERVDYDVRQ